MAVAAELWLIAHHYPPHVPDLIASAHRWMSGDPDPATRQELQSLVEAGEAQNAVVEGFRAGLIANLQDDVSQRLNVHLKSFRSRGGNPLGASARSGVF